MQELPEMPCRAQLPFWEDFFSKIKGEKMIPFQEIVVQLLGCICKKATLDPHLFLLLNKKSTREEDFDAQTELRRDLGSLLRKLCKCCGSSILPFMNQRLGMQY